MNATTIAAIALLVQLVPLLYVMLTQEPIHALVALELAGTIVVLALLTLSEAYGRGIYFNVPMVAAMMLWIGSLVFARFFGRWL